MRKLLFCLTALLMTTAAHAVEINQGIFQADLPGAAFRNDFLDPISKPIIDYWLPFKLLEQPTYRQVGSGKVNVRVYKDKFGFLTFYWRLTNDPHSRPITGFGLVGDPYGTFPTHSYEVNWRSDGPGKETPDSIQVPQYSSGGSFLKFNFFKQPIQPGSTSKFFYIKTTAKKSGKARWEVSADSFTTPIIFATSPLYYQGASGPLFN